MATQEHLENQERETREKGIVDVDRLGRPITWSKGGRSLNEAWPLQEYTTNEKVYEDPC